MECEGPPKQVLREPWWRWRLWLILPEICAYALGAGVIVGTCLVLWVMNLLDYHSVRKYYAAGGFCLLVAIGIAGRLGEKIGHSLVHWLRGPTGRCANEGDEPG
jgi:hypothetical protein